LKIKTIVNFDLLFEARNGSLFDTGTIYGPWFTNP